MYVQSQSAYLEGRAVPVWKHVVMRR